MKCHCGCGEETPIADRTDRKRGRVKGEPLRFVHGHNRRRPRQTPTLKTCRNCNLAKEAADFYGDTSKSDGLSTHCRECRKARSSTWYAQNTEQARASARKWREENPERFRERQKAWQEAHPKERAELANRRRTRIAGNGEVEKIDPWFIYERDGGRCHICEKKVAKRDMSLDHLVPVSRGGSHVQTNIRLAHLKCNIRRGPGRIPAQLLLH